AAGGAGPRARALALALAPGRAALRPRRARAPGAPPRDEGAAAAARHHDDHGDARPGGGADDGRPHRGHEPRRGRADRRAGRGLGDGGLARECDVAATALADLGVEEGAEVPVALAPDALRAFVEPPGIHA